MKAIYTKHAVKRILSTGYVVCQHPTRKVAANIAHTPYI